MLLDIGMRNRCEHWCWRNARWLVNVGSSLLEFDVYLEWRIWYNNFSNQRLEKHEIWSSTEMRNEWKDGEKDYIQISESVVESCSGYWTPVAMFKYNPITVCIFVVPCSDVKWKNRHRCVDEVWTLTARNHVTFSFFFYLHDIL